MKFASYTRGLCAIVLLWTGAESAQAAAATLTGWLACEKCTSARAAKGDLRPSNPDCARRCIDEGSEAVFISEQGKELLRVKNYATLKEDIGYHLEIAGDIDPVSRTISIDSVKRLASAGASCARPRSGTKK